MERIVGISEAAQARGVAISTLRRWEASGKMVAEHTVGGHRRYDLAKLRPELLRAAEAAQRKTMAYARVSSHDQKDDLERQKQVLWPFQVLRRPCPLHRFRRRLRPTSPISFQPTTTVDTITDTAGVVSTTVIDTIGMGVTIIA